MFRYLRVQPLKSKVCHNNCRSVHQMIKTEKPKKVWVDKGTEFKGSFKTLCEKKGIKTYTTESGKKSAFAKRNIRSLKSLIYQYLEDKWTYSYIDKLQDFVNTINSRTNRVIKLAPNKVTKKDVPRLISLRAETNIEISSPTKALRWRFCENEQKLTSLFEKVISNPSLTKFLKYLTYQQGTLRLIILSTLIENQ